MKSFRGLYRVSLLPPIEPGHWKVQVRSDGHLTINVLGARVVFERTFDKNFLLQFCFCTYFVYSILIFLPTGASPVDFLYYFATVANETHPGLARLEGSPVAGQHFCSFKLVMWFLPFH